MDSTLFSSSPSDYQWYSDSIWPKLVDTDPLSFPPLDYGEYLETPAESEMVAPAFSTPVHFPLSGDFQMYSQSINEHEFIDWSSFDGSSSDSDSVWSGAESAPATVPKYIPGTIESAQMDRTSFEPYPTVVDRPLSTPAAVFNSRLSTLQSREMEATQPIRMPSQLPMTTASASLAPTTPTRPRTRRSRSMELPVPVPGLTKKTRGRKVPTTTSEDCPRKWKCSECDARFVRFEHLKRHTKSIHTDEKLVCPHVECGRTFSRKDNLKLHMRSHRGSI